MPVEIVKLYSFKNKILLQNKQLASQFNEYFGQIIDSLELYDYPCNNIDGLVNDIDCVMLKLTSHLSIKYCEIFSQWMKSSYFGNSL